MIVYILRTEEDITPKYVGITTKSLKDRLYKHIYDINRATCKNYHKKNWFNKNKGKIIIEKIDQSDNIEELKNKEKFYIKKYRDEGINLLNMTEGGDGANGYKHSEETIKKMSGINNIMYGKKHTEEWIKKAKNRIPWNKGLQTLKPSWNKNIPHKEETKKKISNSKIGKKDTPESRANKSLKASENAYLREVKIECLINNNWIEFSSATKAAIELNLLRSKIVLVCKGERTHTGGYKFRYKKK